MPHYIERHSDGRVTFGSGRVVPPGAQEVSESEWINLRQEAINDAALVPEPVPEPKRNYSFIEFLELFTDDERAAIVNSTDTQVKLFLLMATGATAINVNDIRTAEGLSALVAQNLITSARKTQILQGQQPSAPPPMANKRKRNATLQ